MSMLVHSPEFHFSIAAVTHTNLHFIFDRSCTCTAQKTYIPTTWVSIGYEDGNVLNPANSWV